jgi:hypothetical protein
MTDTEVIAGEYQLKQQKYFFGFGTEVQKKKSSIRCFFFFIRHIDSISKKMI